MEDEIILALKGFGENQMVYGMDLLIVLEWIRESMKKRRVEEVLPINDIDAFLNKISKVKEPILAKKIPKITIKE